MRLASRLLDAIKQHQMWAVMCGAVALTTGALTYAQVAQVADGRTVRGTVERFTTAPRGEIDGAVLDDDTILHWPPHVGEHIAKILTKGDRVEVSGRQEKGPEGDRRFEVQSVKNLTSEGSFTVDDAGPPPRRRGPRGRGPRAEGPVKTVQGTVERFTTAPRGEVDGAVLNDGTVIHWPPHLQNRYKDQVRVGERVEATGVMETGPEGDTHLEVQKLNGQTGEDDSTPSEARDAGGNRDQRLRELQEQLNRIQRELDRLRREQ